MNSMDMMEWTISKCEYLRYQAKYKFNNVKETWLELGKWALPHRTKWMQGQTPGARNNFNIVDPTHIIAHRSYVAGFLEGNTSASRPWIRVVGSNPEVSMEPVNHKWLDIFTRRCLSAASMNNYYHAAAQFYADYGCFNTGTHLIEEQKAGFFFHTLEPGSYFVLANALGEAIVLVREFSMNVKALVDEYGKKDKNGSVDWSNFSIRVKNLYDQSNYVQTVNVVQIIMENEYHDPTRPQAMLNRKWISLTYELGTTRGAYYEQGQDFGFSAVDPTKSMNDIFLRKGSFKRKPFIVGASDRNSNFEYGEKGPTLDALGLIKSLNKKAISKDQALEQMIRPAIQGPANLRKSYVTTQSNAYVPIDSASLAKGGLKTIHEINPSIQHLVNDITDMRQQVGKIYYSDYLLYLSQNPKTRTATETNAIVQEQQLVIGPNLQSLNWTYNVPVVDFLMSWVLDNDPHLPPPPPGLSGQFLRPQFISVFAQAQKSADLPSIERYIQMIETIGQMQGGAKIWDKVNLDKLCDIYEDRLFLPEGLNNPQSQVDAQRQQAMAMAQRQQMMNETIPALAGAQKDIGAANANAGGGQPPPADPQQ